MRLTPVSRAIGLQLARDLPPTGPGQIPLLRAGAAITDRFARALRRQYGIHAVWVDDELSAGIQPVELLPEPVRAETATQVHRALTTARSAFARSQPLPDSALTDLAHVVDAIAASIVDSPDAALALYDLASADQYTHRHSVNVTSIGLLVARTMWRRNGWIDWQGERRWDRIDERLATLGMGLLLHDVGKMAVPAEILNKPGRLTEEEWAIMRTHPDAGIELLHSDAIGPLVKSVVRDHHERWNGSGYPRGIAGTRISQFARIAAVADVYDAVTSERPYKDAGPPAAGVKLIVDGRDSAFDPEIVDVFRRVIFPYPVGTEVQLPDGQVGVVATVDPERPDVPTVRVPDGDGYVEEPYELPLSSVVAV